MAGLVLVAAAAVSPALAHTGGSNGYASIAIGGGSVRYSLTLWPATLPPAVAGQIQRARAGEGAGRDQLLGFLRDKVTLVAQGRRCVAGPGSLLPPSSNADSITLVVDFACGGDVRALLIRDDLFDVFGADYHTLARIDAPGRTTQFVFSPETRETRVTLDEAPAGSRGFALLGIEHILTGWDHLLFLAALLLRGGGPLAMLKVVTAFTVAHSLTLALAVLGAVSIPDRLVESVIALSIAWVAVENLAFRKAPSRRWLVSFAFGLVHGLGFASALEPLALPAHQLVWALVGFNVGVEAGQALVIAPAVLALAWLRRRDWERPVVRAGSVALAGVGAVWFVARLLGA